MSFAAGQPNGKAMLLALAVIATIVAIAFFHGL